jgi:hypothetical protein
MPARRNISVQRDLYDALQSMKGAEGSDSFDAIIRDLLAAALGDGVTELDANRVDRLSTNSEAIDRALDRGSSGSGYVESVGYVANAGDSGK